MRETLAIVAFLAGLFFGWAGSDEIDKAIYRIQCIRGPSDPC